MNKDSTSGEIDLPHAGIDEHHRGQLATGQDVRPDRDRIAGQVLDDALVEALEPGREERQMLFSGELLDQRLIELAALRRQSDHPVSGAVSIGRIERCRDDVDPQHHARAAAVRVVVHLALLEGRRVPVVEQPEVELGAEDSRKRPLLGEPGERVRDEREDIDAQSRRRLATQE